VDGVKDGRTLSRSATVGLVGLHIAHKTPQKPSWIWSTFEHVNNLQPIHAAEGASFSSNNPLQKDIEYNKLPQADLSVAPLSLRPKPPVEVKRCTPLPELTKTINAKYQTHESIRRTIWANYFLVATQWVQRPDPGESHGKINAIPGNGVANVTLETYAQRDSCITCHSVANDTKFIFFPSIRAKPSLLSDGK